MEKGILRKKIMNECPEGFKIPFTCWVDSLVSGLGAVLDDLTVTSLSDLSTIEAANDRLRDIFNGLY